MKLDLDTFLTDLALFSGAFAGIIVGFNIMLYGLTMGDMEPRPIDMLTSLALLTVCIVSAICKLLVA